jgi:hypothetical protein
VQLEDLWRNEPAVFVWLRRYGERSHVQGRERFRTAI